MGNKPEKYRSDTIEKANLKPGDLIKIARSTCSSLRAFYHYAVYVGDGEVIHVTKITTCKYCKCPDEDTFVVGNTATECQTCEKPYRCVVVSQSLKEVLKENEFTVANNRDKKNSPLPPDQIIARARACLGPVKYNWSRNNCEHFANWCRYDIAVSSQTSRVITLLNLMQSTIMWNNGSNFVHKMKKGMKIACNKCRNVLICNMNSESNSQ